MAVYTPDDSAAPPAGPVQVTHPCPGLTVRHHYAADHSDPRNRECIRMLVREWRRAQAEAARAVGSRAGESTQETR